MGFKKAIIIAIMVATALNAKVDITKINDICLKDTNSSCKFNKNEVKALKLILNYDLKIKLPINGEFDKLTQKAVMLFQKRHNLPITGYVGKLTKLELNKVLNPNKDIKANKSNLESKKLAKKDSKKLKKSKKVVKKVAKKDLSKVKTYKEFRKLVDLRKSYAIFQDKNLLKLANRAKTILKVDVSEQRVKLLVNGKVALDAPCTTGAKRKLEPNTKRYRDKRTPLGTFKILEKIPNKRSTIFGKIYKNGKVVFKGDRRLYKGSWKGAKFVGAELKNWMRITSGGIGLHASKYVKRYPGSNGCIRLPKSVAKTLFTKVKKGTKVLVVN